MPSYRYVLLQYIDFLLTIGFVQNIINVVFLDFMLLLIFKYGFKKIGKIQSLIIKGIGLILKVELENPTYIFYDLEKFSCKLKKL